MVCFFQFSRFMATFGGQRIGSNLPQAFAQYVQLLAKIGQ